MNRLVSAAVALAICLSGAGPHVTEAGDGEAAQGKQHLIVDLCEGSHIVGRTTISAIRIKTEYSDMSIPLQLISTITIKEGGESALLVLSNGDRINGVISLDTLPLQAVFGRVSIGLEHIREIQVKRSYPPDLNLALASRGVRAVASMYPEQLNDGISTGYTGSDGWAACTWPCDLQVLFPEAVSIATIRFLLWDGDGRHYRYQLELSPDGRQWYQVVDRSSGEWRSWQEVSFTARTVKAIKLRGLYNSVNTSFHVVELEAYPPLAEPASGHQQ
jgi:hypothetical protein